ncbi:MAG: hypothetical protein KDC44_16610 [Phaeodactylibacter sp.]|nr:hypothetical protein [Phaeodactylibacter sp.]
MKTTFFFCILSVFSCTIIAQRGEFPIHDNGLIYTENTMDQLAHIVDSLNLKYKNCNADPAYFAIPQALAHHVYVEGARAEAAFEDIQAGMAFSDFLKNTSPKPIVMCWLSKMSTTVIGGRLPMNSATST